MQIKGTIDNSYQAGFEDAKAIFTGNLLRELKNCRNELCLKCGKYRDYPDYCGECRWNDEHMQKWEAEND